MILVDSSVWIDHFRKPDQKLQKLLDDNDVLMHPLVLMELALGSISSRGEVFAYLMLLPQPQVAELDELFTLIESRNLCRKGIGITDLHLLASAMLGASIQIWTRDRKLHAAAKELGVSSPLD